MPRPAGPATCTGSRRTDQPHHRRRSCSTKEFDGVPTSTVKIPEDVLIAMFKGEMDPQKVFMTGKASADDFGDLMKMGMAFDFDKIAEAAGFKGEAAPAATAEDTGPKSWPIGKRYDGGHFLVSPDHIALYADATNDANPAYTGDTGIAPHMLHTRMFKECMFQIATDPELDLDLLRLVHGEHDATFHRPVKAWDLMQVRGELISVDEKSSGLLVTSKIYGFVEGELVVEAKTTSSRKFQRARSKGRCPRLRLLPTTSAVHGDSSRTATKASLDDNPISTPTPPRQCDPPRSLHHGDEREVRGGYPRRGRPTATPPTGCALREPCVQQL